MLKAITHTPVWVWILLAYLVYRGIRSLQPQIVKARKLVALPLLFVVLSIETLVNTFQLNASNGLSWLIGLGVGVGIGWIITQRQYLKVDKEHGLALVQGSPLTLAVILAKFGLKYYLGYRLAVDPELVREANFAIGFLLMSGFFAGLLVGRLITYLYAFQTGPFGELQER